jgi:hypothetical protein
LSLASSPRIKNPPNAPYIIPVRTETFLVQINMGLCELVGMVREKERRRERGREFRILNVGKGDIKRKRKAIVYRNVVCVREKLEWRTTCLSRIGSVLDYDPQEL